jgi:PKD repeat protein
MKLFKALPILLALLLGVATTPHSHAISVGDVTADAGPDQGPFTLSSGGSINVTMYGLDSQALVPGAVIASYVWSDGTTTKTGATPTFTFSSAGIYTIGLVVTDSFGSTASSSMRVTINNGVTAPLTVTPAANKTVECDGQRNLVAFALWLETHGGSVASGGAPPFTWTNNFNQSTSWAVGTGLIDEYATVIFTAADGTGPSVSTTATFYIKDTTAPPLNWTIDGAAVADYSIVTKPCGNTVVIKVQPNDLCGGATLEKSYSFLSGNGTVVYSTSISGTANDTVMVSGATNNAKLRVYFKATDDCGNSSAVEWVEIDFERQLMSLKGNEGVGNGIDPNTPGALHNGNNDAPGYFPGNPGAKNKVR